MNKKFYLLLMICAVIIGATIFYVTYPWPQPLVVVSTSPANHAAQNPYLPLVITFNRAPKKGEVTVSIAPNTKTREEIDGNTIKITPDTTFSSETSYTISLSTSPPYTFGFTTETTIENSPGWNEASQRSYEQYLKENGAQDAALIDIRKHVPIQQNGFTVNYSYTNSTYTITLFPPYDKNRANFLSWFAQKGVTNLTTLRLNYVNQ